MYSQVSRSGQMVSLLLVSIVLLTVAGCAVPTFRDDPRPVPEIIDRAESLAATKAYAEAAREYAIVTHKTPDVGEYYLRHGELLERIDRDKDARKIYRRALDKIAENDPARTELIHRLALINANHLYRLDEAEELLFQLPNDSIERHDLAAFLYYQAGQYRPALDLLNEAMDRVRDADQKALLMYHAALIYHGLGDEKNTFGSLYHAINLSEHLGLIRDIENFWEEINRPQPQGSRDLPKD